MLNLCLSHSFTYGGFDVQDCTKWNQSEAQSCLEVQFRFHREMGYFIMQVHTDPGADPGV